MNGRTIVLCSALWLASTLAARAMDTVTTEDGKISGKVTQITPTEVTVEQASGATKTLPVNEIQLIVFQDEPAALRDARTECGRRDYAKALELLDEVNLDQLEREEIKQDARYYRALADARLALESGEKVIEAGKEMAAFAARNSGSYHYLEACVLVGDLLVAAGRQSGNPKLFANAQEYYSRVAKAPWPEYKMRAGEAIGRAQLAQGKPDDALQTFQKVMDIDEKGEVAARYRMAAGLGKARCLIETKQLDQAGKLAQAVIDKTDVEQMDALAYNVLGLAHLKAGRPKDALWAFLHVEILYPTEREARIEALQNLVPLWKELQKPERAEEAKRILKDQFGREP
jgi:tetratricopeptide (TPR) repeat protein